MELWAPRWSADGRHILAFPRAADRLMLFDVKTQKWTELAKINVELGGVVSRGRLHLLFWQLHRQASRRRIPCSDQRP